MTLIRSLCISSAAVLTTILFTLATIGYAGNFPPSYWTGPQSATVGTTTSYSFDNGTTIASQGWYIENGQIASTSQSGTTYYVDVEWTETGSGGVFITSYGEPIFLPNNGGARDVTVSSTTPPTPNANFTVTQRFAFSLTHIRRP